MLIRLCAALVLVAVVVGATAVYNEPDDLPRPREGAGRTDRGLKLQTSETPDAPESSVMGSLYSSTLLTTQEQRLLRMVHGLKENLRFDLRHDAAADNAYVRPKPARTPAAVAVGEPSGACDSETGECAGSASADTGESGSGDDSTAGGSVGVDSKDAGEADAGEHDVGEADADAGEHDAGEADADADAGEHDAREDDAGAQLATAEQPLSSTLPASVWAVKDAHPELLLITHSSFDNEVLPGDRCVLLISGRMSNNRTQRFLESDTLERLVRRAKMLEKTLHRSRALRSRQIRVALYLAEELPPAHQHWLPRRYRGDREFAISLFPFTWTRADKLAQRQRLREPIHDRIDAQFARVKALRLTELFHGDSGRAEVHEAMARAAPRFDETLDAADRREAAALLQSGDCGENCEHIDHDIVRASLAAQSHRSPAAHAQQVLLLGASGAHQAQLQAARSAKEEVTLLLAAGADGAVATAGASGPSTARPRLPRTPVAAAAQEIARKFDESALEAEQRQGSLWAKKARPAEPAKSESTALLDLENEDLAEAEELLYELMRYQLQSLPDYTTVSHMLSRCGSFVDQRHKRFHVNGHKLFQKATNDDM